jgi:hypothetical protein
MRRLSSSPGYARFRLMLGGLFIALGIAIVWRTLALTQHPADLAKDIPSFILGGAMVLLGAVRIGQSRAALRASR